MEWEDEHAADRLPSRQEDMSGDLLMSAADIVIWHQHADGLPEGEGGWRFGRRLFEHLSTNVPI